MKTLVFSRVGDASVKQIEETTGPVACNNAYTQIGDSYDLAGLTYFAITAVASDANSGRFAPYFANSPDFSDEKIGTQQTAAGSTVGQTTGSITARYMRVKAQNVTTDVIATLTVRTYCR